MNTYLHTSVNVLAERLPRASEDWWEESALDKLSYNQREKGFTTLEEFDLVALFRIADKSWYAMRNVAFLSTRERECIRDMMCVRNNWTHVSAMLPGKDVILADLATLHDFFEQKGCEDSLVNEVDRMIEEVKSPSNVRFSTFSQEETTGQIEENEAEVVDENKIHSVSKSEYD